MYFLAYFYAHDVFVIIPKTWIRGIDDQWEKFINNSLNRNQTFLCYYSARAIDVEGRPDADVLPVFQIPVNANFPGDGCYYGKLISYKVSFDDALIVLRRRRNVPPALYNVQRLAELPIPDTGEDESDDQLDDENEEQRNQNEDQLDDETENQSEDERDSQLGELNLQFDGDSEDDPVMQDANCSQNSERALLSVQNNREANGNMQISANVNDSLVAGHIDTSANQAIDSNSRMENRDTQNGVDLDAVGLHTSGRSDELVVSNPQKDAMTNRDNQNGKDECAPTANKSSVINQHETTVAEAINPAKDNAPTGNLTADEVPENSATFDTNRNAENSIEEIFVPANTESNENEPDEAQCDLPNCELNAIQPNDPIKTEAIPLHEPVQANNVELNELLDEEDMVTEELDDDLTIIIDSKIGFAKPLNSNVDGLIKRQNDIVSGDVPFIETKQGRIYKFGLDKITVPVKVIEKLIRWNTHPEKATEAYDKRATIALLLICVPPEDLAKHKISETVKNFINGFLSVRTGEDATRLANVQQYIDDFCNHKAQQASQEPAAA